jgi:SAM-dependent methyltransferase
MISLRRLSNVLDSPRAYALWQAPFARAKLAPLWRHNKPAASGRVLEVGCGPGTNVCHLGAAEYLGLDINPRYIEYARRVHRQKFIVADARTFIPPEGVGFDCIFMNSFLHHIDDENSERILSRMQAALREDGHIHILDLVLPERPSVARWLALHDRGEHPRELSRWRQMLGSIFQTVVFEPYAVRALGVDLWQMFYFKGRCKA